jgi:hypothetical protein
VGGARDGLTDDDDWKVACDHKKRKRRGGGR